MYLDGTEGPPDRDVPPKFCALCGGKLVTRWHPVITHTRRKGSTAHAMPAHTCGKCKVAIRVCRLPSHKLHTTRKAARASGAVEIAKRTRDARRLSDPTRTKGSP